MPKSDRLLAVLMELHTRRRFTAEDLAQELGVSRRTALRYLHELSEAGVPLAARPGPGGGYRVLRDKTLPPLAFTVDEGVSLFFAYQSLQSYGSLPFDAEFESVLRKIYQHLPVDAQHRIDRLRERLEFSTRRVEAQAPHLQLLLEAAMDRAVVSIVYRSARGPERRAIQPVGVYAHDGLWYCPAYCFTRKAVRLFRVDRIVEAELKKDDPAPLPEIAALTLTDFYDHIREAAEKTTLEVELTAAGLRRLEHMQGIVSAYPSGGRLRMEIETSDMEHFARMFLGMGTDARVVAPAAMVERIQNVLRQQTALYGARPHSAAMEKSGRPS
ncbi:MAG: YafY family protein [Thermaerobacter sp.]|nr:YafY family protein [Thermaerobacter sp.]